MEMTEVIRYALCHFVIWHDIIKLLYDADCNLEDPTGKSDEEFKKTIQEIEKKVLQLKEELQ